MSETPRYRRIAHGGVCECEQLAAAMGCDPATISFEFCLRVLQRHWKLNCRHGGVEHAAPHGYVQRWQEIGRPDAVQAILISNAPAEDRN